MPPANPLRPKRLVGMRTIIDYLSQNKRRIARALYFTAFLVEQLPDQDLPKQIHGRTFTIADQLKHNGAGAPPRRKRRHQNGRKRRTHK